MYFLEGLVNKLSWVADTLTKSKSMHHKVVDTFKSDEISKQLVCSLKICIIPLNSMLFIYIYFFIFSVMHFLLNFMKYIGFV